MAGTITTPSSSDSPIGQMDRGMDTLRTVWHALHSSVLAEGDTEFIANAVNDAIHLFEPARDLLSQHGKLLPDWPPAAGKAVRT